jgi:photosystem II stability/assembly factor-like uncharacterized protein
VILSDDGGESWWQAAVPVSSDLTAVWFASPARGWAVGHDGVVLATRDGGLGWERQLDGRRLEGRLGRRGVDESFLDVWFEDERSGFAVGAHGLVVRTADGGETWTPWRGRVDNPRVLHLYAMRPAGGEVWAVGELGLVLRLDRQRGRLEAVPVPYAGSFFGVVGDERTAVAFGLRGTALRTRDGGASWARVETGVEEALTGGAALPDGRLVLVTASGRVLASDDGGATFRLAGGSAGAPASGVAPAGRGAVAVVGAAGVRLERLR